MITIVVGHKFVVHYCIFTHLVISKLSDLHKFRSYGYTFQNCVLACRYLISDPRAFIEIVLAFWLILVFIYNLQNIFFVSWFCRMSRNALIIWELDNANLGTLANSTILSRVIWCFHYRILLCTLLSILQLHQVSSHLQEELQIGQGHHTFPVLAGKVLQVMHP